DAWDRYDPLRISAVLSATAITLKLSNLVFSLTVCGVALYFLLSDDSLRESGISKILKFALVPAVVIALWMARGYTLSGIPFYPSNAFRVEGDWTVPRQVADEEALWISGWARAPNVNAHQVVGNWNWFHPWFLRITGASSSVAGI